MKTISTFFVLLLLIVSNATADGENNYLRASYSAYSTNDSNIVLAGSLSDESLYTATNLNIAEGTSETFQLEVDNSSELLDVQMNTTARLVYYFTYKKVTIYEFGATTALRTITIDNDSPYFGVSSDGTKIYSYDNKQDYVSIFNATNGERLVRFFVNSFAGNNKLGIFNSDKDEFWLKNEGEFYVWSIVNRQQDRVVNIPNTSGNYKFIGNGNTLAYTQNQVVFIANSSNGEKIFNIQTPFDNIDNINFSPNNRYLIIKDGTYNLFIQFDLQENKIVNESNILSDSKKYSLTFHYVNNDNSRALASEEFILYCSRNAEIPLIDNSYFIYNIQKENKLITAPKGFIPLPQKAIISNDNEILIVSGKNLEEDITNALVDKNGKFRNYIDLDKYPISFLEDKNKIAVMDEGIFKVFDIETEQYEREFDTGMDDYYNLYYFSQNGGRIVVSNFIEIKVFNYSDFSLLYTINNSNYGINSNNIKKGVDSLIYSYGPKQIYSINVFTGEIKNIAINGIDLSYQLIDISSNGRFLLFEKDDNEFIVFDNKTKNEIYRKDLNELGQYINILSSGFFGNHELMWIRYEKNPIDSDPLVVVYDFVSDKTEEMFGDKEPIISDDGSLYYSLYCPMKYEIGAIRDPQSSVETTTNITGGVYPNPAYDFIKLDMNASAMNSSIEIFDAYGKQVMSAIYTGEYFDISKLTAGVYFVKVGDGTHKFVKM
ncbi:MAG: T9SS type A sorting domain-containing protein [Ignavibacteriae bacterium]|nr:T9SS type A sorting domain-containing protein [Ignavibacteriota bacterium]